VNRKERGSNSEFELIIRGLRAAILIIFVPPILIGAFVVLLSALNPSQGSESWRFVANTLWKNLLSFCVRLALIPGLALFIYRILLLHRRSTKSGLLAIFLSILLIAEFGFGPSPSSVTEHSKITPIPGLAARPRQVDTPLKAMKSPFLDTKPINAARRL
jgi:hypothetical protein